MRGGIHRGHPHERRGLHRRRVGHGRSSPACAGTGATRGRLPACISRRLWQPTADDPIHVCGAGVLCPSGGRGETAGFNPGGGGRPYKKPGNGGCDYPGKQGGHGRAGAFPSGRCSVARQGEERFDPNHPPLHRLLSGVHPYGIETGTGRVRRKPGRGAGVPAPGRHRTGRRTEDVPGRGGRAGRVGGRPHAGAARPHGFGLRSGRPKSAARCGWRPSRPAVAS